MYTYTHIHTHAPWYTHTMVHAHTHTCAPRVPQVQSSNPTLFDYSSAADCARKILQREGPCIAFFRVVQPTHLFTIEHTPSRYYIKYTHGINIYFYPCSFMCSCAGPWAFFDGLPARVAWLLPRCALAMTGYEFALRTLTTTVI